MDLKVSENYKLSFPWVKYTYTSMKKPECALPLKRFTNFIWILYQHNLRLLLSKILTSHVK